MTLPHAYYICTLQLYVLDHTFTLFLFRSLSVVAIHQSSDHEKCLLIVTREFFFSFCKFGKYNNTIQKTDTNGLNVYKINFNVIETRTNKDYQNNLKEDNSYN